MDTSQSPRPPTDPSDVLITSSQNKDDIFLKQQPPEPIFPVNSTAKVGDNRGEIEVYTSLQLHQHFTSLERRLTAFAESLLGIGQCLDSLQEQIVDIKTKVFQGQGQQGQYAVSSSEGEEASEQVPVVTVVARDEVENGHRDDEVRQQDEGREFVGEGRSKEGDGEEGRAEGGGAKGGDGEVDSGELGNLLSGFVFGGDDDDAENKS